MKKASPERKQTSINCFFIDQTSTQTVEDNLRNGLLTEIYESEKKFSMEEELLEIPPPLSSPMMEDVGSEKEKKTQMKQNNNNMLGLIYNPLNVTLKFRLYKPTSNILSSSDQQQPSLKGGDEIIYTFSGHGYWKKSGDRDCLQFYSLNKRKGKWQSVVIMKESIIKVQFFDDDSLKIPSTPVWFYRLEDDQRYFLCEKPRMKKEETIINYQSIISATIRPKNESGFLNVVQFFNFVDMIEPFYNEYLNRHGSFLFFFVFKFTPVDFLKEFTLKMNIHSAPPDEDWEKTTYAMIDDVKSNGFIKFYAKASVIYVIHQALALMETTLQKKNGEYLMFDDMFSWQSIGIFPLTKKELHTKANEIVQSEYDVNYREGVSMVNEKLFLHRHPQPLKNWICQILAERGSKKYQPSSISTTTAHISHLNHEQIRSLTDAFFWTYIVDSEDQRRILCPEASQLFAKFGFPQLLKFYEDNGFQVRLKSPHKISGIYRGEKSNNNLRSFKEPNSRPVPSRKMIAMKNNSSPPMSDKYHDGNLDGNIHSPAKLPPVPILTNEEMNFLRQIRDEIEK